jgi:hypothetical protein
MRLHYTEKRACPILLTRSFEAFTYTASFLCTPASALQLGVIDCKSVDMVRKLHSVCCRKGGIYANIYLIWNHKKQHFMNWKSVGHNRAPEPEVSGSEKRSVTRFRLYQAIKLHTLAASHILLVETDVWKYTENGYLAKIKSVSQSLYSAVME